MKTTMKIAIALILVTLTVPAQADGWRCLDERCENIEVTVSPEFVAMSSESQEKAYTAVCERFARLRALHRVALQSCMFQYRGKYILGNKWTYIFTEPVFDVSYLLSIELRDSR